MPMMTWPEVQAAVREVQKKSIADGEFRNLVLRDGRGALAKVSAKTLPPDLDFRFLDNTGSVKMVILPDPLDNGFELSDAELEQVAGGCEVASCQNSGPC